MLNGLVSKLGKNRLGAIPEQELQGRWVALRGIGNRLQGQALNAHRNLALQHVNQFLQGQQQNQPVEFNLYPSANEPVSSECAQQQLAENNVYAVVQGRALRPGFLQPQINYFVQNCAQLRPRLERFLIRAAQLSKLIPTQANLKPRFNIIKAQAANLQGQLTACKNAAVALQVMSECQNQLGQLASSPNLVGGQIPVGLEGQPSGGASYPNQKKICLYLNLLRGAQNQLVNALQQGINYQLAQANALRKMPGFMVEGSRPQLAYSQCM
jgi:hypothetical protein